MRRGFRLSAFVVRAFVALLAVGSFASSAGATPLGGATLMWEGEGLGNGVLDILGNAATSCSETSVGGSCSLSNYTPGNGYYTVNSWSSTWDTDPFVTNNFNVTNNSGVPLIFDVTVTSPVVVTGPQTAMSGSVGITLTNTTGSATLTDASGISVYQALIDGGTVRTLFDPVYTQTCPSPFCSIVNSADFGIFPNPPEIGPQANTSIAVRIRFSLSPGDSAGVTSVFNIEAVPEPGTAALLGLGLVAVAIARRRR